MHLLSARNASPDDVTEAVDLGQRPAPIVILSTADTELASLATARARLPEGAPELRLANALRLQHPMSVDLYVEKTIAGARIVVLRILGGRAYWPYGFDEIGAACRERGIELAVLPGDDQPDPELDGLSTMPADARLRLWRYLAQGGIDNAEQALRFLGSRLGFDLPFREPAALPTAGLYLPGATDPDLPALEAGWTPGRPVVAIVFYRALVTSGDLELVDAIARALGDAGLNPLPIFVASLKQPAVRAMLDETFRAAPPSLVLNLTGFATRPTGGGGSGPFDALDCPVLQLVCAGGSEENWRAGTHGLAPRDLAMNVALPEIDGRILARAVSFKDEARFDEATGIAVTRYRPVPDRIRFCAELARRWTTLREKPRNERRVAILLANYPDRDGRLANGVGLDTPASCQRLLERLAAEGYALEGLPEDSAVLMAALAEGPTNRLEGRALRAASITLPLETYRRWLETLPDAPRQALLERWGEPGADPHVTGDVFALSLIRFGHIVVGIQPARGYHIDPVASYHSPDLVPPHGYLAFYVWLREHFRADAVIHLGKHGNLEWLPGKALALSGECWPEIALGPMPHLYPFIVNDPGEGTQAKRRAQAVIVDHMTPPLTRAESYGPLRDLERLIDEYYEALNLDPRRLDWLKREIVDATRALGLDRDLGLDAALGEDDLLSALDNHLCELKELQIRDGLHIFGSAPEGRQRIDLLQALTRLPRGKGEGGDASITRALSGDLGLGFDPLSGELDRPWTGRRPEALLAVSDDPWRTAGDTVERLELLARKLIAGETSAPHDWKATRAVLESIVSTVAPAIDRCGENELEGLLRGLDGRFVEPGPSGAPTRGRLDVLPTGRNFFSVDTRAVPTPAAWHLGWRSAQALVDHYMQTHGEWPRHVALSAWGTANMRTGGDDIAQALALLGCRPVWDGASNRVTGIEVMPAGILGRPRVDVTLRVSGFFRDAFPEQMALIDDAVRAVARLDEPAETNPLAATVAAAKTELMAAGRDEEQAFREASYRVFGSKPGAYGAGLQALIDDGGWREEGELAHAFTVWSSYAYGRALDGAGAGEALKRQLARTQLVLHNQDNREHDILDSDDYYQFQGGLTAAVRAESGRQPETLVGDHSRPETPRIRTLKHEIGRVVRARAANPKWIEGVMRHGYKGAFEIAATVDYLFAWAATAGVVENHHFDALYDAYVEDDTVRDFIRQANPAALAEIAARFSEAIERGLWQPRRNSAASRLDELARG